MGDFGKAEKREERRPIEDYLALGEEELYGRLVEAKRALGNKVVVLGHHYQRDDVICHADLTGDSFKLAAMAAQRPEAEYIVFCGVHFMAESADILSGARQQVILPDLAAGCSMRVRKDCQNPIMASSPRKATGHAPPPILATCFAIARLPSAEPASTQAAPKAACFT